MTPASPTPEKRKPSRRTTPPPPQELRGTNVVGTVSARGSARVNIRQIVYAQLSEVAQERERQEAELKLLQEAIVQKYASLSALAATPAPAAGNPYLFLQPFRITDQGRFFGRADVRAEGLEQLKRDQVTFLSGNHGVGKTSLIRAGLAPALLEEGHLPLLVNTADEPLELTIKRQLLPNIEGLPFLKGVSLTEFLRMVTSALPEDKLLFLLVDDFQDFFKHEDDQQAERTAAAERAAFYEQWRDCFNGATPEAHWLFCVPSDLTYLLSFFKGEVTPKAHELDVAPFGREAAREAITRPAEALGIQIEDGVIAAILDALGPENIDPAELQVVCYVLAGGMGTLVREWTMASYTAQGGTEGILRDYLDRSIEELDPPEREPAWRVLASLARAMGQQLTEEQLIERMKSYGVSERTTRAVLVDLLARNLVDHAAGFALSNPSLRPRIEKWEEARSARERAREEAVEQWRSIRNSALRGLLGGALGFLLADQLLYTESRADLSLLFFLIILDLAMGSLAGLIVVFTVDVALASYSGPRKRLAYPVAALGGALALAWVMVVYADLNYVGDRAVFAAIPWAAIEGALWGAATGLAAVWVLESARPRWLTVPAAVLGCGLMLAMADLLFGVLRRADPISDSVWVVGLAGALLPAFILAAALVGEGKRAAWRAETANR